VVLADSDQIIPARRIHQYLTQHNKERAAAGALTLIDPKVGDEFRALTFVLRSDPRIR
jgi:hypothetical protein